MLNEIKKLINKDNDLRSYASKNGDAIYFEKNSEDIRTSYFRDIDRILYSLSFIRYQDKTQVFSYITNDHICKRMLHVQLVSKIARTIGRALGLNEDLIEAAALGHDLGHVPFGHEGERILNEISLKYQEGYFNHNIQSVRNLMVVENFGKGLNISVQVLDAIMCHNGEFLLGEYKYVNKSKEDFLKEYERAYYDENILKNLRPMTLEGCVVRVSDIIAYLGRDIDDAVRLNVLKREDIPKSIVKVLGNNTKDIVNNCILDILKNSLGKDYLKLSKEVLDAIVRLKEFNYKFIYSKSESHQNKEELSIMFNMLFDTYLEDIKLNNLASPIIYSYLNDMSQEYKKNNSNERIVIDYIAGMTDDYFLLEYKRISALNGNNKVS